VAEACNNCKDLFQQAVKNKTKEMQRGRKKSNKQANKTRNKRKKRKERKEKKTLLIKKLL
tara:strand:- start:737 stop:916 length:180 start_codon:yes stop_codon:yes gene_type:complete